MKLLSASMMSVFLACAASAAEDITSKVDGTLTFRFAPPQADKAPSPAEQCSGAWNKTLKENRDAGSAVKPAITRLGYRNCMYRCLDSLTKPATHEADTASDEDKWGPCPFGALISHPASP